MSRTTSSSLEDQIDRWRGYLRQKPALKRPDVDELEAHLRDQVAQLTDAGLDDDEAFLIAVKRIGSLDALSREFAREHSERLWKQLIVAPEDGAGPGDAVARREGAVALAVAAAAAMTVKVPVLFGQRLSPDEEVPLFYGLNASLFVFPLLAGYFMWKRRVDTRMWPWLLLPFVVGAAIVNAYPYAVPGSHTAVLSVLHLPIALWLAVGVAYAGGDWLADGARMNFVRFTGELAIYYVLIALGGGVLIFFTMTMFMAIGVNAAGFVGPWLVPCGAAAGLVVGSWLVEAKKSVIENMAPVLTRLFTPLFTVLLLAFLVTMAWTGRPIDIKREVLILFDLLLVVVVGLVLYAASARDRDAPPNLFDRLQLLLVVSALLVDVLALTAIASRISEFGFTPNRVAALGENLILLVNLTVSAWHYGRFLTGRGAFHALEHWQVRYLPVYSLWASVVVTVFPPLFSFQ